MKTWGWVFLTCRGGKQFFIPGNRVFGTFGLGTFQKRSNRRPGLWGTHRKATLRLCPTRNRRHSFFALFTFSHFSHFPLQICPGARMLSSGTMSDGLQIPAPFSFAQLLFTSFKGSRLRVSKGQGGSRPTSDHENTIGFQSISKRFGIRSEK